MKRVINFPAVLAGLVIGVTSYWLVVDVAWDIGLSPWRHVERASEALFWIGMLWISGDRP